MITRQQTIKSSVPVLAAVMAVLLVAGGCSKGSNRVYKISDSPAQTAWHDASGYPDASGPGQREQAAIMSEAMVLVGAAALNEYHIGPGDVLTVQVFQLVELEREAVLTVEVDEDGAIYLPLLNDVPVAGMTVAQVKKDLIHRLGSEFIRDPKVDVSIKRHGSKQVLVQGHVGRPGHVLLRNDSATLMDVIAQAGGIKPVAAPNIEILRGQTARASRGKVDAAYGRRQLVPVVKLYAEGPEQVNPVIMPGDVVQIRAGSEGYVYVSGAVKSRGAKPFRRPMNIIQALTMAGGATNIAQDDKVKLIRRTPQGQENVIIVDLQKIRKGQERNLVLAQNDTIVVPTDPVKKFFDDAMGLLQAGVRAGVDVTYDAGSDMGIPDGTTATTQ